MHQVLAPGVQHGQEADPCPEAFGIGGHLHRPASQPDRAAVDRAALDLVVGDLEGHRVTALLPQLLGHAVPDVPVPRHVPGVERIEHC